MKIYGKLVSFSFSDPTKHLTIHWKYWYFWKMSENFIKISWKYFDFSEIAIFLMVNWCFWRSGVAFFEKAKSSENVVHVSKKYSRGPPLGSSPRARSSSGPRPSHFLSGELFCAKWKVSFLRRVQGFWYFSTPKRGPLGGPFDGKWLENQ